jgi:hypothetical protein
VGLTVDISGGGKDFEQVEDLIQNAVLADIVDKGLVPNKYKKAEPGKPEPMVHKCYFVWIVAEEDSDGKNKRVFESFTVSLDGKATLRKRYKELTGKKDEDLEAMKANKQKADLDALIGAKRKLVLSKEDGSNGKPFIKVQATMPVKKGEATPDIPADFVRKQDRQE